MIDTSAEARHHAIELEQCSLFVDSTPLKRAMTDAAEFLRALAAERAQPPADVVDRLDAMEQERDGLRSAVEHANYCQRITRDEANEASDRATAAEAERDRMRAALERIVDVGTRATVVRVGDMYDLDRGYEDQIEISAEAEIARAALAQTTGAGDA